MADDQGTQGTVADVEQSTTTRSPILGVVLLVLGAIAFAVNWLAIEPSIPRSLTAFALPPTVACVLFVWWLATRSARPRAKIIGLALVVVAAVALLVATTGAVKVWSFMWGLPAAMGVMLLAYAVARGLAPAARAGLLVVAIVASVVPWTLLRSEGAGGQLLPKFTWMWRYTPESAFTGAFVVSLPAVTEPVVVTAADWPGFRGPQRDSVVPPEASGGATLDWAIRPPVELWRTPIGPGWSSFAVVGDLAYTQEQAADRELVVCFDATTGTRQWVHADDVRFEEFMGGDGPRATPLVHDGRVYALGATGVLNCLDARTGAPQWAADVARGSDHPPEWGFASSPLIHDGLVYVSPAGVRGGRMMALSADTGEIVWVADGAYSGYSSAQLATLNGRPQILLFDYGGLVSYDPATGDVLWEYAWPTESPKVNQPHVLNDQTVLVGMGYGEGMRSLGVAPSGDGWAVTDRWATRRMKPKFNDFVVYGEHVYALDEGILACAEIATGKRLWKDGRYGFGQILLVGDTLVIITEDGELVLVKATPSGHEETARIDALTGKTWNHPAIAQGRLFVRNASEAACYDLRAP